MDVLHVTEASLDGVRRHVLDLIRGLGTLGVSQGLAFSPRRSDQLMWRGVEWCQANGVSTYELPMDRRINPWADLRAARQLLRIVRVARPRLLHLHSSKAGGVGRLTACLIPRIATVYTPH